MGKEWEIIALLLNSHKYIADIAVGLGYGKDKHSNVTPYITVLESRGWVKTEIDKSVKRPGSKPTRVTLKKKDFEILTGIWENLPEKRSIIIDDTE
jgi:DNA-binding MarR family transcriptional regulator